MTTNDDLGIAIDDLLKTTIAQKECAANARQDVMRVWDERRANFEERTREWMRDTAFPRLCVLSGKFLHAEPAELSNSGLRAGVHLPRTVEFPADATVGVRVVHEAGFERAWLVFEVSIIPMLMDYEQKASLELDVREGDAAAVASFIEARIVHFVADYLRVLDPESYYQKNMVVIDPVCGMTIRRAEAAAIEECEGRKYYFCVAKCRELFVAEPARYVRFAQTLGPTTDRMPSGYS